MVKPVLFILIQIMRHAFIKRLRTGVQWQHLVALIIFLQNQSLSFIMEGQMNQMPAAAESSRTRRRSEAQELFNCECGKTYLTFSALYLHAKLKHNKRLTNKKNENNHKTEEINNKKYTTYFLKESTHQNQNHNQSQEQLQQSPPLPSSSTPSSPATHSQKIQLFLTHLHSQRNAVQPPFATYQLVLLSLMDYLREIETLGNGTVHIQQQLLDIAYYFNEFCTYYVPILRKADRVASVNQQSLIHVLKQLWKWLKTNSMTTVDLTCSEAYLPQSQI